MPGPIRISVLADTKDIKPAMAGVEASVNDAAATAERAGSRINGAFDGTAEHADNVASKGAQAAGGLSGLGSVAQLAGGQLGAFGGAMVIAGTATQAAADAGDLLNVVTESTIVKKTLEKAATLGSAAASIAATAATKTMTAGQWLLNAALTANPIGLVVVALAALAVGFFIAWKRSSTFRSVVTGTLGAVAGAVRGFAGFFTHTIPAAVSTVVGFVKARWPLILAIMAGPLGLVVLAVVRNFDKITDKFHDIVGFVASVPGRIGGLAGRFADAGGRLIGGLIGGLSHSAGFVGDLASEVANDLIDRLNSILPHSLSINKGPIHVSVPLFPTIPHLAKGGITTGPMLALIGDNPSGREAVIPLDGKNNPLGARNYFITVNAPVGSDPYTIGETLAGYLEEFEQGRGGED